jgi:hypothetical protein
MRIGTPLTWTRRPPIGWSVGLLAGELLRMVGGVPVRNVIVTGRTNEIIIRQGENISALEVVKHELVTARLARGAE